MCRGGCGRERRVLEHGFCIQSKRSALHCQDRVRTRGDHGLVVDQFVALVFGNGVAGAGERDDAVGGGRTSRHHGPSVHEGQNEQRPAWALYACAQCGQSAKVSLHQFDQAFAALGRSGRLRDQSNFLDDAVAGEPVGDLHEGHRRGLQHCDRVLRTRALGREHQGRTEAEHAFGRQLTHIADARLLRERTRGIKARAVDGDDPRLETKRVKDFGHRAANRYDPAGIGDGDRAAGRILDGDVVSPAATECAQPGDRNDETQSQELIFHRGVTHRPLVTWSK